MDLSPDDARQTERTRETIERFNEAFNRHDVGAMMALMTEDCLFENTYPPPDGEQFVGAAAVRTFWEQFFAGSPRAIITPEDLFACGDRCTVRWVYRWIADDGSPGHVRGVDVFRVRDGLVAEKCSYVKG
jgi:ketosteroid isomerase-like protein